MTNRHIRLHTRANFRPSFRSHSEYILTTSPHIPILPSLVELKSKFYHLQLCTAPIEPDKLDSPKHRTNALGKAVVGIRRTGPKTEAHVNVTVTSTCPRSSGTKADQNLTVDKTLWRNSITPNRARNIPSLLQALQNINKRPPTSTMNVVQPAAPPTPQEIQRKLSVHSVSRERSSRVCFAVLCHLISVRGM